MKGGERYMENTGEHSCRKRKSVIVDWIVDNIGVSLLIGVVLVAVGSFVDTKDGFATLETNTLLSLSQQDSKLEGFNKKLSALEESKSAQREEFLSEIHDLRAMIDDKFTFLIQMQQEQNKLLRIQNYPPGKG